ncbi:uncharacterized protein ACNLHF_009237 [Anomaloglossus baeobatrachus]
MIAEVVDDFDCELFTDAAGGTGFGAYFGVGSFLEPGAGSRVRRQQLAGGALGVGVREASSLIRASLAPGTWAAYEAAWRDWMNWRQEFGVGESEEDSIGALLCRLCRMASDQWSFSRVNRFLAGVSFGCKLQGVVDITKNFLVRQAVRGLRKGVHRPDSRRPVSFQLLEELGAQLERVCVSHFEMVLFQLAFSWAFFGATRIGELVSPASSRAGGVLGEDTVVSGDTVEFWIRRSKTDQFGRGRRVTLWALAGSPMCPVSCFKRYLELGVDRPSPLLKHQDGSFLSRYQFVAVFRKCLERLGLRVDKFSAHSFRIGAATEAERWGLPAETVQIGRWESKRFRLYVRPHLL